MRWERRKEARRVEPRSRDRRLPVDIHLLFDHPYRDLCHENKQLLWMTAGVYFSIHLDS